jgi:signal transduction histidine kinase
MLPDQYDDPEYRHLMSDLVPAEVSRIVALSERLRLARSAPAPGFQSISLARLLRDVVTLEARARASDSIAIRLHINDSPLLVDADPHSLVQLFRNLIRNAVDATSSGAYIDIVAHKHGETVVIEVLDEGPGLDPTLAHAGLSDFATTKPTGLGLGLSICHQIARAHGATLTVENRTDRTTGARAAFAMPLAAAPPRPHNSSIA